MTVRAMAGEIHEGSVRKLLQSLKMNDFYLKLIGLC